MYVPCKSKILLFFFFLFMQTMTVSATPQINSEAAYLINADNNQVLYEKNKDKIMYPASTTKIVTALVALKHGDLNSIVTVNASAVGIEGSSLELKVGDQLTLQDLLRGMMAVSGNDAAQAVAEHVGGGSPQVFINWMNDEATTLQANNTHFSNPHGLPDPYNYTTAHDLGIITAYAYHQPGFVDYVSHNYQTIHFMNRGTDEKEENINELLGMYPGSNGVKTGFTREAGECLVAAAQRNGVQLITVVLHSENRWQDAIKLLDYGFKQIESQQAANHTEKPLPQEQATNSPKTAYIEENKVNTDIVPIDKKSYSQIKSPNQMTEEFQHNQLANLKSQLLELSVYGSGSSDAAYLFQTDIFKSSCYIGPALKYDSHKANKISIGVRLAVPALNSGNLVEFSAYGDHSLDAAYLFQSNIFNRTSYIGPALKYDPRKKNKMLVGIRLTLPL
ncbi:D-alanyl-D-alanine carboxypeptidase [Pelosinus propionicus DSM 13327]|uniref:D-alanyl-D-alanine carboxypeptidase n=2 Tax=Pelosinus TaxID=365348 RepID=A0A1I4JU74_9FIRM|nr:D-alanyl-D-alanine carboxypeptidase [Pelosinus propionicus DSM 13327]